MSEDWKPGDLAVCVDAADNPHLEEGRVYSVRRFVRDPRYNLSGRWSEFTLFLRELKSSTGNGFCSLRFRKVKPDQREACEEEFITLLNRTKRRVGA